MNSAIPFLYNNRIYCRADSLKEGRIMLQSADRELHTLYVATNQVAQEYVTDN